MARKSVVRKRTVTVCRWCHEVCRGRCDGAKAERESFLAPVKVYEPRKPVSPEMEAFIAADIALLKSNPAEWKRVSDSLFGITR